MSFQNLKPLLLSSTLLLATACKVEPDYIRSIQAEAATSQQGVSIEARYVSSLDGGDWIAFNTGSLGAGADLITLRYAKGGNAPLTFELRKGSLIGEIVASGDFIRTGDADDYIMSRHKVTGLSGTNDLYLKVLGTGSVDRLDRIYFSRAERLVLDAEDAMETYGTSAQDNHVEITSDDGWMKFEGVFFGTGFNKLVARYSRETSGSGTMTVHLDSLATPSIAEMPLPSTGSWTTWDSAGVTLPTPTGIHDMYLQFSGGGDVGDFQYFKLREQPVTTILSALEADEIRGMRPLEYGDYLGGFRYEPWIRFDNIWGSHNLDVSVTYATDVEGVAVEVRKGTEDGLLLGTIDLPATGDFVAPKTVTGNLSGSTAGFYDMVLKFTGGDVNVKDLTLNRLGGSLAAPATITHFGQDITLVGANAAYTEDRYSYDFGSWTDLNLEGFEDYFDTISEAGGNSARIWLHTTAQVTPYINSNGRVIGLSKHKTDAQVIAELRQVLDAAWERGIIVTFDLFSFGMLCDEKGSDFDGTGPESLARNALMLTRRYQTYFDKALTPMVSGLKDHPALFAWEVFNEPEGMDADRNFCSDGISNPVSKEDLQRFVNRTAAHIHGLDSNVKVTSSSHTELFNDYSNATLTSMAGADPDGTLDFYALHWYDTGWTQSPYDTPASFYNADRPIIIGEYSTTEALDGAPADSSARAIINNGFAGAWPWALVNAEDIEGIEATITEAGSLATTIDKAAIEACIEDKPSSCYND